MAVVVIVVDAVIVIVRVLGIVCVAAAVVVGCKGLPSILIDTLLLSQR